MAVEIPPQLFEALSGRDCVIMLGAGFAVDAGLPTGQELADHLCSAFHLDGLRGKPLQEIAERVALEAGRPQLDSKIAAFIGRKQRDANRSIFELFGELSPPPTNVITTNYDKLLEETLGRDNVVVIHNPDELHHHLDSKINLYKIHGDLDSMSKAVITTTDYTNYERTHKAFVDYLSTLFRQKSVLFIGYAAEDWNFLAIHNKVLDELDDAKHPCYIVSPSLDPIKRLRFQNLKLRHIAATAREFLEALSSEQVDKGTPDVEPQFWKARQKPPNPTEPLVVERNPFTVFRAEDMSDQLWESHLFQEPNMYNIYADSVARGNTVVEGHRGSGKSMLLLSMSYPIQRLLGRRPEYIGLYVKIQKPVFVGAERRGRSWDEWTDYFLAYFNLICAEEFVKFLHTARQELGLSEVSERELSTSLSRLFPSLTDRPLSLLDLHDAIHSVRIAQARAGTRETAPVPGDLMKSMMERVRRFVPSWEDAPLYLLIDEFDRLVPDQQQVVNLLLTTRGPTYKDRVYYKIAVKSYEGTQVTPDGSTLEAPDDYLHVYLDRLSPDNERKASEYTAFVERLANERLEKVWQYGISVRDLLVGGTRSYAEGDYSGFENIVTLSSFLPRDFLELCKDIVFYGNPNLLVGPKPDKLTPIAPKVQNAVIKIHAYKMLQDMNRIPDERGRSQAPPRSQDAIRLVESLGRMFRTIHEGSRSKEPRTVSEIIITDEIELTERSRLAIQNCLKARALRNPITTRPPQNPRNPQEIPGVRYELHRLLCAHYRLSLARRWPKRIQSVLINELIEAPEPREVVDRVTSYFLENDSFTSRGTVAKAQSTGPAGKSLTLADYDNERSQAGQGVSNPGEKSGGNGNPPTEGN